MNKNKIIRTLFLISVSLCLCFSISTQELSKKPLKDWKITNAKKPEHIKIVKFLKEQNEIIKEDSISGIASVKNDDDRELATYYQELGRRVIENAQETAF